MANRSGEEVSEDEEEVVDEEDVVGVAAEKRMVDFSTDKYRNSSMKPPLY